MAAQPGIGRWCALAARDLGTGQPGCDVVLLHPERGVALLGLDRAPDGAAAGALRRRFAERSPQLARVPIVALRIGEGEMAGLPARLDAAFARGERARPPADPWVTTALACLREPVAPAPPGAAAAAPEPDPFAAWAAGPGRRRTLHRAVAPLLVIGAFTLGVHLTWRVEPVGPASVAASAPPGAALLAPVPPVVVVARPPAPEPQPGARPPVAVVPYPAVDRQVPSAVGRLPPPVMVQAAEATGAAVLAASLAEPAVRPPTVVPPPALAPAPRPAFPPRARATALAGTTDGWRLVATTSPRPADPEAGWGSATPRRTGRGCVDQLMRAQLGEEVPRVDHTRSVPC